MDFKILRNLYQHLKNQGLFFLSKKSKEDVDVNHFIIFSKESMVYFKNTITTTMLTHINDDLDIKKLKEFQNLWMQELLFQMIMQNL